jgi:hypothetical protein
MGNARAEHNTILEAIYRQPYSMFTAVSILAVISQVADLVTFVSFEMIPFFDAIIEFYSRISIALWGFLLAFVDVEIPRTMSIYMTTGMIIFGMSLRQKMVVFKLNRGIKLLYIVPFTNRILFTISMCGLRGFLLFIPVSIVLNLLFWPAVLVLNVCAFVFRWERGSRALVMEMFPGVTPVSENIMRRGLWVFVESLVWVNLFLLISFSIDQGA